MKSFLTLAFLLGAQLVQAAPIENQIRSLARRINNNSEMAERLSQDEKIQVLKGLNNIDSILARVGNSRPDRAPRPRRSCENDSTTNYQSSFLKIKNFAYQASGLDYSDASAIAFAKNWLSQNSCERTDEYIKTTLRLKSFAYALNGLDYDKEKSVVFALANSDIFCTEYNIEQEFKRNYNFAYSAEGLNMSKIDAQKYAFTFISKEAFSCRNQ